MRVAHIHLSILTSSIRYGLIELVHRDLDASQAEALDDLLGLIQYLGHLLHLLGWELTQDVVDLSATREIVADAKAQAGVVLRAQHLGDILQPVVSGVASLRFQALGAKRQGQVVYHHQQVFYGDILFLQPVAHGVATQVHEGVGLQDDQLGVFRPNAGDGPVAFVAEAAIQVINQVVHHPETDVMACA